MTKSIATLLFVLLSSAVAAAPPAGTPETRDPAHDQAALRVDLQHLQAQMSELATRMGALSARMGDAARARALRYIADPKRGMLGLVLRPADQGMRVIALTPGAPAERAGMAVGDVIVGVDGKPLRDPRHSDGLRPLDMTAAGKPLTIKVLRGGTFRNFTVTPQRRRPADWQQLIERARIRLLDQRHDIKRSLAQAGDAVDKAQAASTYVWYSAPWWGLNLASLNADLGSYFGADQGALVLSSQPGRYPGLKAGDVITSVDGTEVQEPEDVMRALSARPDGESVQLVVQRHGKAVTVNMKVPPLNALLPPPPPPPPAPPAPPPPPPAPRAPPAPPVPQTPTDGNVM